MGAMRGTSSKRFICLLIRTTSGNSRVLGKMFVRILELQKVSFGKALATGVVVVIIRFTRWALAAARSTQLTRGLD